MNGAAFSGGGIANRNGSMTITHSLIDHNRADQGGGDGGGIINFGGDCGSAAHLVVRDSTIAFNTARLAGGIIQYDNPQDSTALESVTLAYNQTGDRGGPGNLAVNSGTASVRNTILGFSQGTSGPAPNCGGTGPASGGANVVDDATCALNRPNDHSSAATRLVRRAVHRPGRDRRRAVLQRQPRARRRRHLLGDRPDRRPAPRRARLRRRRVGVPRGDDHHRSRRARRPTRNRGSRSAAAPATTGASSLPGGGDPQPCTSPYVVDVTLPDGAYEFRVYASDDTFVARSFTVDTVAPAAPGDRGPVRLQRRAGRHVRVLAQRRAVRRLQSPYSTAGLAPGDYALAVRAVDAAGNRGAAATRAFSVAAQQPVQTPVPTPTATPTPPARRSRTRASPPTPRARS